MNAKKIGIDEILTITICPARNITFVRSNGNTNSKNDCLYKKLRGYLILGTFLGFIPIQGLLKAKNDLEHLHFRYFSASTLVSFLISLMLLCDMILGAVAMVQSEKNTAASIAFSSHHITMAFTGLFSYNHFWRRSNELVGLLQNWKKLNLHFTKEDIQLGRDIFLIATASFMSNLVNTSWEIGKLFSSQGQSEPMWQFLYKSNYKSLAGVIPYNPVLFVLLFSCTQISWYALIYAHVFVIVIARAFYFKFKALNQMARCRLLMTKENNGDQTERKLWILLAKEHDALCRLLEGFAEFLSPIIFTSFARVILSFSLAMHALLTRGVIGNAYYCGWVFAYVIGRICLYSASAAKVNDSAHETRKLFVHCPHEFYSVDMQRTMQRISSETIGLHGLHCFYFTKPFYLTVIKTLFTIQIVLFQQKPD